MHRKQIRQCWTIIKLKGQSQGQGEMTLIFETFLSMMHRHTKFGQSNLFVQKRRTEIRRFYHWG